MNMKRTVRLIFSVISTVIIVSVTVPILAGLALQVGFIQNYTVGKLTDWLSERSGMAMSIGKVKISFFNRADIDQIYVKDLQGDTLIYADRLSVRINGINFITGNIDLGAVSLQDGVVNLKQDSTGVMNIKYFIDTFRADPPRKINLKLTAQAFDLVGMRFTNRVYGSVSEARRVVDFRDLSVKNLNMQVRQLSVFGDKIDCRIERLTFQEKSGFQIRRLSSGDVSLDSVGMRFKNLSIKTGHSDLQLDHFDLQYDNWGSYKHFTRDVRLDAKVADRSLLSYRTLDFFMKQPSQMSGCVEFAGEITGSIADLRADLRRLKLGDTQMDIRISATGLPDIENTRFQSRISNLETTGDAIMAIYSDMTGGRGGGRGRISDSVRGALARAGKIGFNGTFDGLLRDFTAIGRLSVGQGAVEGKLQVMPASRRGDFRLQGHVETNGLNLGNLLRVKDLGRVSFRAGVDAVTVGGALSLTTAVTVGEAVFRGYAYHNIRMDGQFSGRRFEGRITSEDPNIHFHTEGRLDFRESVPAYDFEVDLREMNLYALNLNRRDSISVLSARFRAHATGTTPDNINGTAAIDSLSYINHLDTVQVGPIHFQARNTDQSKSITMRSGFADAELRGRNSYSNIARFFGESLRHYLPSLSAEDLTVASGVVGGAGPVGPAAAAVREQAFEQAYYLFKVSVKEANNVAAIFVPGLEVAKGTSLNFVFNPFLDQFSLSVKSDYILQPSMYMGNLLVECRNQGDSVSIFAAAEQFGVGNFDFPNLSAVGGIRDNKITLATRFSNPENGSHALITTLTTLGRSASGIPVMDVAFQPTAFSVGGQTWYVAPGHIILDSMGIEFRRFRMYGDGQQLAFNGRASASERDTLRLQVRRFGLQPLGGVLNVAGYEFGGLLMGEAQVVAPFGAMQLAGKFRIDSLAVNEHILGDVDLVSRWDRTRKWMNFELVTQSGTSPVTGIYDSPNKRYRVNIQFPVFDMKFLEPLLQGVLEDTEGSASADLTLTGSGRQMLLNGTIDVKRYDATVAFTKARYSLAGPVTVTDNRFELPRVPITDGHGGGGTISAWFDSDYFRNLTYGVKADFTDMLGLNTTAKENASFHGTVYGTGSFSVEGTPRRIDLDVRAETSRTGTFILPLTDVSTITEADFITFREPANRVVRPQDRLAEFRREQELSRRRRRRRNTRSELNVNLNLGVRPNMDAQIVMDPRLGDAIKGRGNGRFRINIVPDRDVFTMDGQFEITEGTYLFTLYGILANKFFTIQPGGTIMWQGDPVNPLVDIDAVYRVRTPITPLTGQNTEVSGGIGNVNVNAGIHLSDNLFSPTVRLSISAPGANTETQTLLSNLLNTEEAMTQQFAYLLLSNSFMPSDQQNAIGTMSGSLAGVAGMEFLSNQISNLISGSNYNIRFGYRPQGELTSEEVTFDIGADIIADKLSFEVGGNYDVGTTGIYSNRNNPWSVDGYVTWTLNKAATLKLKGFTRTIDRYDESQGLQDSGIGIYYRQDFQDGADLKQRYRTWRETVKQNSARRREERRARHRGDPDQRDSVEN